MGVFLKTKIFITSKEMKNYVAENVILYAVKKQ